MAEPVLLHSSNDVVGFLKDQHRQIEALFDRVLGSAGQAREDAFHELRRLLAIHETAEEEFVHPTARRALPGGEAIVAARLHEEKDAKTALALLETLNPVSEEFETRLRAFRASVVEHARCEEHEELDKLTDVLDDDQLRRMRRVVLIAESVAPTRPHAGHESAAANLLTGPFAAMVDRVRDALIGPG